MLRDDFYFELAERMRHVPDAAAIVSGGTEYPKISGTVRFFGTRYGVLVTAEFRDLPTVPNSFGSPIFAMHIHEGESCTGDDNDDFSMSGMHFNPDGHPHPYHAGDLPPLFSSDGRAFCSFLTGRFAVDEIVGKTLILHDSTDDFKSQPSGNAGRKIACGEIVWIRRGRRSFMQ